MTRHPILNRSSRAVALGLLLAASSAAWSQDVFKCTVAGKTVYQSEPCAGQGKALPLAAGPSAQEIDEARARAEAEKNRATSAGSPVVSTPSRNTGTPYTARKVDCAKLNQQRADAYGRRNATVREGRSDNIDRSGAMGQAQDTIRNTERQLNQAGCPIT